MAKKSVVDYTTKSLGTNSKKVSWNNGKRIVTRTKVYADKKTGQVFERNTEHGFDFGGLLKIVFLILLLAAILSSFTGNETKDFYSLLIMLQNIPEVVSLDRLLEFFSIQDFILTLPDWLAWSKPFWEVSSGILTLFAFIIKGAVSALTLLLYFCRWLFL